VTHLVKCATKCYNSFMRVWFILLILLAGKAKAEDITPFVDAGVVHGYSFTKRTWNLGVAASGGLLLPLWSDFVTHKISLKPRITLESHKGIGIDMGVSYSYSAFNTSVFGGMKYYTFSPALEPTVGLSIGYLIPEKLVPESLQSFKPFTGPTVDLRIQQLTNMKIMQTGLFLTIPFEIK
jgi:hypothetical protein